MSAASASRSVELNRLSTCQHECQAAQHELRALISTDIMSDPSELERVFYFLDGSGSVCVFLRGGRCCTQTDVLALVMRFCVQLLLKFKTWSYNAFVSEHCQKKTKHMEDPSQRGLKSGVSTMAGVSTREPSAWSQRRSKETRNRKKSIRQGLFQVQKKKLRNKEDSILMMGILPLASSPRRTMEESDEPPSPKRPTKLKGTGKGTSSSIAVEGLSASERQLSASTYDQQGMDQNKTCRRELDVALCLARNTSP